MLGLADRGRIRRLLKLVLSGDAAAALAELDEAHELGIDPTQLLRGLMESLHAATRTKAGAGGGALQSAEERESTAEIAQQLAGDDPSTVADAAKGLQDVETRRPARSGSRRCASYAAELPDPASLMPD